jgi:DNA-binding CsgD family transcriptional regulator
MSECAERSKQERLSSTRGRSSHRTGYYGEFLRRAGRRKDARRHLRAAFEAFERLRAAPWEERARRELRASGERARERNPSTLDQLTAQELQVAQFVATGQTNKEVAAQLFLSPRTIDYHLRKIFAKLGISSRAELIRLDLETDARPEVTEPVTA